MRVTVKRLKHPGMRWGIFVDNVLAESGFFSKKAAIEYARLEYGMR